MSVQINLHEALRYAGVPEGSQEMLLPQMTAIAQELNRVVHPRYTWKAFPIEKQDEGIHLVGSNLTLPGGSAWKMLRNSTHAVLLVVTLGTAFDDWLRRVQKQDMSQALLTDACGSAMVEAVCDAAEQEIAARYPARYFTDRFSPGYGDLPLAVQPELLALTDSVRRVGVTLTPTFLMNPSKSVTAVIGIADTPQPASIRGCAYCRMRETCQLRKGGKHCV